ncbi:MAG: hypothetical protein OSJ70_03315 [Bacilli bacterium]|nr:hypothetical protein [Bacilli bacterium]
MKRPRPSELYTILNNIAGMDISFILDDFIGNFAEPDIPVNIDLDNFEIDIETPYGIMFLSLKSDVSKMHRELTLRRAVSETFCEEYKIKLGQLDEDFLKLKGQTFEKRSKGFVVNFIDKQYDSSNLTEDSEENRRKYENGEIIVDSIASVAKIQSVYKNKVMKNALKYCKTGDFEPQKDADIFTLLYGFNSARSYDYLLSEYTSRLSISLLPSFRDDGKKRKYLDVLINNSNCSWLFTIDRENPKNIVGRAFNIYQGIINEENYADALALIKEFNFNKTFSHEDYGYYYHNNVKDQSISAIIESIAGSQTTSYKREYTAQVQFAVNSFYNSIKNNPFLFDEYSQANTDKKRELEKNGYIKQILLRNPDNM